MHPQLSRALVDLFNDLSHRGSNSQLIFTTHDTNLMDQNLLRRDELWIIDKNQFGASTLSSIVDFNVRNDKKLDKDYLLGRFGGIPAISQQLYVTEHA
jgi:AAA15 family ATPase/GTPase